ncbi:MAG TPA: hypothetical protein VNO21_27135 [Polyangiaceae bacterium]|nr:hypothetical protein [Polyangiaceae bacterium]
MIIERGKTVIWRYDAAQNILFVSYPNVTLDTPEEIVAHFDMCLSFWRRHCHGRKVYCVLDYSGLEVNLRHLDVYTRQLDRMNQCHITRVRYGGSALQRTAVRLANLKLHTPSNLYGSLEEALRVVHKLKSGELPIATDSERGP